MCKTFTIRVVTVNLSVKSRNVSLVANRSISILNVVQIITYTDVYERISTDEGPKVIQKDSSKIEIKPKIIFV